MPKFLSAVLLITLALDYKSSDVGGGAWQYTVVIVSFACSCLAVLCMIPSLSRMTQAGARVLLGGAFCILASVFVAYFNEVPLDRYVRMIYPLCMLYSGFMVGFTVLCTNSGLRWLVKLFLLVGLINSVWSIYVAFALKAYDVYEIRHQIGSFGLSMYITYGLSRLIVGEISRWPGLVIIAAVLGVQLMTITRSYAMSSAVIICFSVCVYVVLAKRRLIPKIGVVPAVTFFAALFITFPVIAYVLEMNFGTVTRWSERIFEGWYFGISAGRSRNTPPGR